MRVWFVIFKLNEMFKIRKVLVNNKQKNYSLRGLEKNRYLFQKVMLYIYDKI